MITIFMEYYYPAVNLKYAFNRNENDTRETNGIKRKRFPDFILF
jgi:hypothetical protein